jgi:rare lipoprotein A
MNRIAAENRLPDLLGLAKSFVNFNAGRQLTLSVVVLVLAACSSAPRVPISSPAPVTNQTNNAPSTSSATRLPTLPPAGSGRGGYYQDDGPGDHPPEGLLDIPDAIPKIEPYSTTGNKPYVVFGKTYTPMLDQRPFKQRGTGSWYGKKFHGQKTSSGELYDMYKLTAAHPTLPIPSYARVTNLSNGAQVIVRINDRGPFHSSRIIDLSYTAALKLGYLGKGSSELEVERLLPDDIARINAARQQSPVVVATVAAPIALEQPAAEPPAEAVAIPAMDSHSAEPAPLESARPASETPAALATVNTAPASGYYLQLGAFGDAGNAEAARSRLMQNWDSSLPPLGVIYVGVFYRLDSGPFTSRAEAALAAQKVQATSDIKAMIVQR